MKYQFLAEEDGIGGKDAEDDEPKKKKSKKEPVVKDAGKEKVTATNVFKKFSPDTFPTSFLCVAFKFRYEKIGKCLKPQKPYMVMKSSIALAKGKPAEAANNKTIKLFLICVT